MWDSINAVIAYLISEGGAWGVLVILLALWAGFKEWSNFKTSKEILKKEKEVIQELVLENKKIISTIILENKNMIDAVIKESDESVLYFSKKQDALMKVMKDYAKKTEDVQKDLDYIQEQIEDITKNINISVNINEKNNEKINELNQKLELNNDKRIKELKELLYSYNKTMQELSLTLGKIKFILQSKIDIRDNDL